MVISVKDIVKMCKNNDIASVRGLLDDAGLDAGCRCPYTIGAAKIASALLGAATATAELGMLSEDMAMLLIERLSLRCEAYWLIHYMLLLKGIKSVGENENITKCIALLKKCYTTEGRQETRQAIEEALSTDDFMKMLYALDYDAGEHLIRRGFNDIIMRRIYNEKIISPTMLFAFMASSLMTPEIEDDPLDTILEAVFRAYDKRSLADSDHSINDG